MKKISPLQSQLLIFYKLTKKILDDNKIPFSGIGGTAIGAVRENGFIPWDDDIDITIPYEHKERFLQLIRSQYPNWAIDHSPKHKSPYLFTKIYNEVPILVNGVQDYLFIDIFWSYPRVKNPKYKMIWRRILSFSLALRYRKKTITKSFAKWYWAIPNFFLMWFIVPIFFFSNEKIKKMYYNSIMKSKRIMDDKKLYHYDCVRLNENEFTKTNFEDMEKIKFEDTDILISATFGKDNVMVYGDVMVPPPENEIVNHSITLVEQ